MKMSNQMIGAIMMALQNCLANQTDILPVFKEWNIFMKEGEIFVDNPPAHEVDFSGDEESELEDFLTEPEENA